MICNTMLVVKLLLLTCSAVLNLNIIFANSSRLVILLVS